MRTGLFSFGRGATTAAVALAVLAAPRASRAAVAAAARVAPAPSAPPVRALITGGGGYLGRALAAKLLADGYAVTVFGRGSYPDLAARGADVARGDLTRPEDVLAAAAGQDVIFHLGAKVGEWGSYEEYAEPNVRGTRNVLDAALARNVGRLVFVGSPSALFDGNPVEGRVDPRVPLDKGFVSAYARTKAEAERLVLAANGRLGAGGTPLATVSVRPRMVLGAEDPNYVRRILAKARAGRLRRVGDADPRVDWIHVDDAVEALARAAERLSPGSAIAGRGYFLSSGDPRPIWELTNGLLAAAGLPPIVASIPRGLALAAAGVAEFVWRRLGLPSDPPLTRLQVALFTTPFWFDIDAIRRDLDWSPRIRLEEALRLLKEEFAARRAPAHSASRTGAVGGGASKGS